MSLLVDFPLAPPDAFCVGAFPPVVLAPPAAPEPPEVWKCIEGVPGCAMDAEPSCSGACGSVAKETLMSVRSSFCFRRLKCSLSKATSSKGTVDSSALVLMVAASSRLNDANARCDLPTTTPSKPFVISKLHKILIAQILTSTWRQYLCQHQLRNVVACCDKAINHGMAVIAELQWVSCALLTHQNRRRLLPKEGMAQAC